MDRTKLEKWTGAFLRTLRAQVAAGRIAATGEKVFVLDARTILGLPRAELDGLLVAANRAGLVRLVRCDLVSTVDEHKVEASSIRHLNAEFHFIRI